MPWIPFESRSAALQQQITEAASLASPEQSASDLYNENDLGLLAEAQLAAWLQQALASSTVQPPAGDAQALGAEKLPELRESEAFDMRSLRWLRLNARTAADKAYAKQLYRQTLFKLWRKHVAASGETYYPELRDDLLDKFRELTDHDHN